MEPTQRPEPRQVIDARRMEPPMPFVLTMEALEAMAPGEVLLLIIDREPLPLYRALRKQGFAYETQFNEDYLFEIRMWRPAPA